MFFSYLIEKPRFYIFVAQRYKKSVNEFRSLFVLMTASKGDESTKYSQSPRDDDERSARLKAALSYLRKRRY